MPGGCLSNANDGTTRDRAAVTAPERGWPVRRPVGSAVRILRPSLHEHGVRPHARVNAVDPPDASGWQRCLLVDCLCGVPDPLPPARRRMRRRPGAC